MKKIIDMRSKCIDYEMTIGAVSRAILLCYLTSPFTPPPRFTHVKHIASQRSLNAYCHCVAFAPGRTASTHMEPRSAGTLRCHIGS